MAWVRRLLFAAFFLLGLWGGCQDDKVFVHNPASKHKDRCNKGCNV